MDVRNQPYLPKLDGLRAVSIFLVFIEHYLWGGHLGDIGVTIFFVISGYLITSILVSYADSLSVKDAAKKFYWRRTLRLFPVFYLCIAVTAAFNVGGMRETWWINALYLTNFKVAFDGAWNGSSHFWSLCVEEQFYILWFMIVVLVPRRYLLACITFFIIIAPLYRVAMYGPGMNLFFNFLLPGAMDSLATGALIAYAVNFVPQATPWKKFIEMRTALLLLSLGAIAVVQTMGDDGFQRVFQRCFVDIFSACLVSIAIEPAIDWRFNWLGNKTIRHFGKISYGLYVYHYFLPHIIDAHWNFDWIGNHAAARLARFAVLVSLAVAIAEMSWHFVEKPIMRLKDRISFGNDRPVVARESS